MRSAVEEVQPLQVALSLRLAQSRPLYEGFKVSPRRVLAPFTIAGSNKLLLSVKCTASLHMLHATEQARRRLWAHVHVPAAGRVGACPCQEVPCAGRDGPARDSCLGCEQAIKEGPGWGSLSEAQQRAVEGELRDFVLGGVALEVKGRAACMRHL